MNQVCQASTSAKKLLAHSRDSERKRLFQQRESQVGEDVKRLLSACSDFFQSLSDGRKTKFQEAFGSHVRDEFVNRLVSKGFTALDEAGKQTRAFVKQCAPEKRSSTYLRGLHSGAHEFACKRCIGEACKRSIDSNAFQFRGWTYGVTFGALDSNLASRQEHTCVNPRWMVQRRRWFRVKVRPWLNLPCFLILAGWGRKA